MKRLVTAAALAALSIPASAYAGDWTGAYLGAGVGSTKADTQNLDDSDAVYSLHGGYDYDMGEWVLGGELEYSDTNIGVPSVGTIDQIGRFKVRAGYDFGQVMGYFLAGVTRAETDFGNDNGMKYGIGVAYNVTDNFVLSGEYIRDDFDNFANTGSDMKNDTFQVRASYRF